jgi:hypothetical protein
MSYRSTDYIDSLVRVYGTRVHNFPGVIAPRDAQVASPGISRRRRLADPSDSAGFLRLLVMP